LPGLNKSSSDPEAGATKNRPGRRPVAVDRQKQAKMESSGRNHATIQPPIAAKPCLRANFLAKKDIFMPPGIARLIYVP
jgi:hypothetical protein